MRASVLAVALALGASSAWAQAGNPAGNPALSRLDGTTQKVANIPAGPLGRSLAQWAASTGVALSFDPALTEGHTSPALAGSLSVRDGFARLLAGSGLELVTKTDGSFGLQRVEKTSAETDGVPNRSLQAVTVTAQSTHPSTEGTGSYTTPSITIGKQEQSLRETPQSVSVITRQRLDDQNLTKVEDAVKQTTGITVERFDGSGSYNLIRSRGFEVGGLLLDGIPIAQGANYATALDAAFYDRIEVLRGPASLLQGTSEPGGSIYLARKRALAKTGIGLGLSAGNLDLRRADVDVTGALNAAGSVRGRLALVKEERSSHVATVSNDKQAGYGTLEWDIAPSTTVSIGYARQDLHGGFDQGLPTFADGRLIDLPISAFSGLRANRMLLETTEKFLEVEHRFDGGGQLKFSARDIHRFSFYRSARSNSAAAANGVYTTQIIDFQQERKDRSYDLFYSGSFTALGRDHRLLAGISRNFGENLTGNFVNGNNLLSNIFQPDYDRPYPDITLPGYQNLTTRQERAAYVQTQLRLTDPLTVVLGGRLSFPEVNTRRVRDDVVTSRSEPGRQFTPSVAALYRLNDNLSLYTSYAEAFVVQTALDAAGQLLEPRTGSQIEFGIKGEFLNKRLNAHAAVFRINDKNRAIADPAVPTASIAGSEVRSQGFELEATGQLRPGWDLSTGYAYTETAFVKAPAAQQGQVFSPVTPRHQVNLFTRYALGSGPLQGWSVGGGLLYKSAFFSQSGNFRITSGDYTIASALLGYQVNEQIALNLTVENLFDKKYYEKVSAVNTSNFYGEPRRVTLALKAKY